MERLDNLYYLYMSYKQVLEDINRKQEDQTFPELYNYYKFLYNSVYQLQVTVARAIEEQDKEFALKHNICVLPF